jgi:hypothetical protein
MNLKMSAPSPSPPPPSPPPTNNDDNPPPTNNQNNNENNNNNNAPVQYEFMELPPTPGDNTTAHTVTQFISPVKTADQSPHSDPPSSHHDFWTQHQTWKLKLPQRQSLTLQLPHLYQLAAVPPMK